MLEQINTSLELIIQQTQVNLETLGIILLIPWTMYFISLFEQRVLLLGIVPRTIHGLVGILFAPLLHGNFNHIFFNSIPLLVLSNFILMNGLPYFLLVTLFITLCSGFLLWCFGKPGLHIGASGLITGYWALLVSDIYQQGTVTAIILGIISAYYFAGIFFGIFPAKKGVSWEGHLFGLLSGFALSYLISLEPGL
ncbi:rhomboid family intramembrane serine protease [Legionella impletisoli]|uniref:Rhomboid family intramembrane serine protease n=1 Tax=Legionella impletisoli TaxID=343510 RepID=A0A917JZ34_9GAMM|nr:rhomboid family intramembrane serine protease [Legionella impletisoli]GGI91664.1 rhomboid family intramembrane serine protease [Legionella impletisoli]